MNPIFTYTNKNNLQGYWYDSFISEFDSICEEHIKNGRAKSFAFIVYDLHSATHLTLEDQGAFVELDRISGSDLTVFYFNAAPNKESREQETLFRNFNRFIQSYTGNRPHRVPFILFFDFAEGEVTNFYSVDVRDNEKYVLHDLVSAIEDKVKSLGRQAKHTLKSMARESMEKLAKDAPSILYKQFIGLLFKGIVS